MIEILTKESLSNLEVESQSNRVFNIYDSDYKYQQYPSVGAVINYIKDNAILNTDLVIINYEDSDSVKKEKIKSLFQKEDGTLSQYAITKTCIFIGPMIKPSGTGRTVSGQWTFSGGNVQVSEAGEATAYLLAFNSMNNAFSITYDVTGDKITYQWLNEAFELTQNKVDEIGDASGEKYPSTGAVIRYVEDSIDNIQETINIQKDSSITETGVGKLDIASANIFTATTKPHFYKVGASDTTLYNGILYNGTVPFKNVTDDSLVRIQKDAVIYYAGGVAYCFTGEGIYSLLWDDTEKKGWVTKIKMDNESYYIHEKQDSLPNVTVTAGDFTWNVTERTLTITGAASTTKTATIKFNEDVSGLYFSLSNTSGTGRYGILSVKVNSEDYYIGHLQGLGTDYGQWEMKKNDVLTITYEGDLTSTANETFVFKIMHWQKAAETTSAGSYANYVDGMSQLSEQMTTARIDTNVQNLKYDFNNSMTDTGWIISTVLDPNDVCTYNNGQVATGLQIRKVGKTVYLNLTISLNLGVDTAENEQYLFILNEKYRPAQAIYFTALLTYNGDLPYNSVQSCTISISPNGKVEILNYKEVAQKQQGELGGNTLSLNQLVSYPI